MLRNRYCWIALLVALLVWLAVGVVPLAPLEGDGAAIAQGAYHLAQHGWGATAETYRFEMQPGTYVPLALSHRFFGLETFASFAVLSAVAALAVILLAARWISRRTSLPFWACAMLMLVLQETWTSAYYPNANVLATAVVLLAMNVLSDARGPGWLLLGGLVFGLAVWTRFDTLLLAPAVAFLLPPDTTKATLRRLLLVGLVAGLVALGTLWASGGSLAALVKFYTQHHQASGSWGLAVRSGLAFFSGLAVLLTALGAVQAARHAPRDLLLALVATAPFLLLLRSSLTTPKYLLALAPFVALLMAHGVLWIQRSRGLRRTMLVAVAVVLFLLQYPLGVQLDYRDGYHPAVSPTLQRLASIPCERGSLRQARLVVGAGATMSTHDSIRLSSGILFSNVTWHHYKQEMARCLDALAQFLDRHPDATVGLFVEESWEVRYLAEEVLLRGGYQRQEAAGGGRIAVWSRGQRQVWVLCGPSGLEEAQRLATTGPVLALVIWHDRLPAALESAFPQSTCLTPGFQGHAVYQLQGASP